MYFWWRDVIWWWQRQTFSLLILLLLKVHDCTYIYTYIYTLWHLWQIIALEMGTNNFNFFLRLYRKKRRKQNKHARARTHLTFTYVLRTQLTYTHFRRLDTWFFRETKIHILQLVIKYLNRATYIYLYQIFSVLFSEMKMSLSINTIIMCFCVREKKWTNKQKIIINFAISKIMYYFWAGNEKTNKNELEKSVTPPYVALLFAKSRKRLLLCTTSTTKISKNHPSTTLLWKKILNTVALNINEAELCFLKKYLTVILAFIKKMFCRYAVYT